MPPPPSQFPALLNHVPVARRGYFLFSLPAVIILSQILFSTIPMGKYPLLLFILMGPLPSNVIFPFLGFSLICQFLQIFLQFKFPFDQFSLFPSEIFKLIPPYF